MWILEYPDSELSGEEKKTLHLLFESSPYIIGRSAHAQFRTDKKRISKVQLVISFTDHALIVDNRGKGKFNLNGEYIPNGKCFKFQPKIRAVRNLRFSFRPEPFEFSFKYKPLVINHEENVKQLKKEGYPAEYSADLSIVSHYQVPPNVTFRDLAAMCQKREDPLVFITQQFIDALLLHAKDVQTDFRMWWPKEEVLDIYYTEEETYKTLLGNISNLHFVHVENEKIAGLAKSTLLWSNQETSYKCKFQGLVVCESSKLLNCINWKTGNFSDSKITKRTATNIIPESRSTKKRKIYSHSALLNLPTMANFGGDDDLDDFEVIRTQEPEQEQEVRTTSSPIEEEDKDKDKNEDKGTDNDPNIEIPKDKNELQPRKTEYLKVDMDVFANSRDVSGLDLIEDSENEIKNQGEDNSDSLLRVFQKAKARKMEQAKKEDELLDSLDKTGTLAVKVRKIKLTGLKRPAGPKRYDSSTRGLFGESKWSNRVDYSKFRKISFTESNPITDSTVKGIKMKKASYNSDGVSVGQVTNRGEKEMMDFNVGIKELDNEFEPSTRKRPFWINRHSKRRATKPKQSSLFVTGDDSNEDEEVDDTEEPIFFSSRSTQRRNLHSRDDLGDEPNDFRPEANKIYEVEDGDDNGENEDEDEDDIPTFRKRSGK